jgi:phage anti-repressor protein
MALTKATQMTALPIAVAVRHIGGDNVLAINARELHAYLDSGQEFSAWIRARIQQYGFAERVDFEVFDRSIKNPKGGRPSRDYMVSLDMAKELAMVEKTVQGRVARRYFIDCEKELRDRMVKETAMTLLLLEAPREWKLRFEPPFYKALSRMSGLSYEGHSCGTPPLFGKITDEWVYQVVMPPEILEEMRERRTGSQKLHQWLTEGGLQKVEAQIVAVTALANSSPNYQDFAARCSQSFEKPGQIRLVYPLQSAA